MEKVRKRRKRRELTMAQSAFYRSFPLAFVSIN